MAKRDSCRRSTNQQQQQQRNHSKNSNHPNHHQQHSSEPLRHSKGRARTRASGLKLIQDPKDDDKILGEQLAQMGLYAAHTLGDGNCLFRALSDQSFGKPDLHDQIRQEVCDYLEENEVRYKAFVDIDEEESWERRLSEMRKLGTYGGHLELSAYANLHQRPIKVIQPGMIYIIGYEDESPCALLSKNGKGKAKHVESDSSSTSAPLYIVYHQWEHYSSVRNLAGPHSGPPQIRENLQPSSLEKEETNFNSTHDPTHLSTELSLLRKSLPEEVSYTNQELKEMINRNGSWEKVLEEILEEVIGRSNESQSESSSSKVQIDSCSTKNLKSISLKVYREPTPSSTSVTTASSPANSTTPSSISVRSITQLRKISRSHSRSPERSDSPDEGIGRRLRRRRTRSSNEFLQLPRSSTSLSSCSTSESVSSENLTSPETQSRSLESTSCSVSEIEKTNGKRGYRNRVSRTSTSASSSHSPLSKSMSRKEIRQAQRKNRERNQIEFERIRDGLKVADLKKDGVESIGLFKELKV
ncbi:hypothetical protein DFH28DRAFT_958904 [Melampsora americana]|nr:hypothetical protein DFH28DRAFT_958904 [Melampsora americana]